MKRILVVLLFVLCFCSEAKASYTYYVSYIDGNDDRTAEQARSSATPWKTITRVNSFAFGTGDDVYFKRGETWVLTAGQFLEVDWSGSSSDRVTIGAYGTGALPVIDGNNVAPSFNLALVHVGSANYITIENLEIKNSLGGGVIATGHLGGADYVTITGCKIHHAMQAGTMHMWGADHGEVSYNEVYDCARDWFAINNLSSWGQGIFCRRSNDWKCRYNTVYRNFGEGIDAGVASDGILVEHNTVYENIMLGIYTAQCKNVVIRYNLVYGTTDKQWWRNSARHPDGTIWYVGNYPSNGIEIATESQTDSDVSKYSNIFIYGNTIAYCAKNINVIGGGYVDDYAASIPVMDNLHVYNNTLIEAHSESALYPANGINSEHTFSNSTVRNNIVVQSSGEPAYAPALSGLVFGYNLWSKQPIAVVRDTQTDPAYAAPDLIKDTGWLSITSGSLTVADFALKSGSAGIDAGIALTNPSPDPTLYAVNYLADIIGTVRPRYTTWDIGAYEFFTGGTVNPETCQDVSGNLVSNCGAEDATYSPWWMHTSGTGSLTQPTTDPNLGYKNFRVTLTTLGDAPYNFQFSQSNINLPQNTNLRFSARVRASRARDISVSLLDNREPYPVRCLSEAFSVGESWGTITKDFTSPNETGMDNTRLMFYFAIGAQAGEWIEVDTVAIYPAGSGAVCGSTPDNTCTAPTGLAVNGLLSNAFRTYLSWGAPSTGCTPTEYVLTRNGQQISTGTSTEYLWPGLPGENQSFTVRANNSYGQGAESSPVTMTTSPLPSCGMPTGN